MNRVEILAMTCSNAARRRNDIVVGITTNFGTLNEDLLNRAMPR